MSNCRSCGIEVPDGQDFCSMCYGDVAYGRDGYYQREMERAAEAQAEERRARELEAEMIREDRDAAR